MCGCRDYSKKNDKVPRSESGDDALRVGRHMQASKSVSSSSARHGNYNTRA